MLGEQEIGEADDGGQHIVEVMRHAAGELADRLHLLALGDLDFERFVLGRIEGEDEETRIFVIVTGNHELDRANH